MYNYSLRYRRFDQVLSDVLVDFKNYALDSLIEPQELIKVVKRCNYDLGLRINKTKPAVLEICKGFVKLPNDFYILNYALVCDEVTILQGTPQGTWIEDRPLITPYKETNPDIDTCSPSTVNCIRCGSRRDPCDCSNHDNDNIIGDICTKPRIEMNCKGEQYELVQVVSPGISRTFKRFHPIKILENPQMVDSACPNMHHRSEYSAWLRDGYMYSSLQDAVIYISYQGQLEDEDGNLLLPDHDLLNEYYEFAIKERILQNLYMNDEPNTGPKLTLIKQELKIARNQALNVVNMPNFEELRRTFNMNRRAQYSKFYDMFKSTGSIPTIPTTNGFINGLNK